MAYNNFKNRRRSTGQTIIFAVIGMFGILLLFLWYTGRIYYDKTDETWVISKESLTQRNKTLLKQKETELKALKSKIDKNIKDVKEDEDNKKGDK